METERQPSDFFRGSVLDELNAMVYLGNSLRPLEVQSEWDMMVVEDVNFEIWSKEDGKMVEYDRQRSDCSEPLNVTLLAIFFFFLISKKNILKEPQENKRPTKEYRGGHKQRENTRENKDRKSVV